MTDGADEATRGAHAARTAKDARPARPAPDVMHGRNLAGAEYGANEAEQTAERDRVGRAPTDEAGETMITEAELERRQEDAGADR